MSTPRLVLNRDGVKRLMRGHPWLHADKVAEIAASDGDLAVLEGPAGVPRGLGLWNSDSRLALRVVSRDPGLEARDDWWRAPIDRAIARRREQLAPGASACRWVHAEADGVPGLVLDRYDDVGVLQAGCLGVDRALDAIAAHLVEEHGLRGVLARNEGAFRRPEGLRESVAVLAGEVPPLVEFDQAGVRRRVNPYEGQKTGTYLDQRENQIRAASVLDVGRVLDAFCNDGGFTLQLAGAGSEVLALDASESALQRTREHAELAGLADRVTTLRVNVFEHLRELEGGADRFDAIVLDPPALAKTKRSVPKAVRGYRELNLRALRLLRPGGKLITCSCSFHLSHAEFEQVLTQAASDARVDVQVRHRWGAAACHPVRLGFPESDYLKVVVLETL